MLEIEECSTKNPTEFWNYIRKLGPNRKNEIPWAVNVNRTIETDKDTVLKVWKDTFETLYNTPPSTFDDKFKEEELKRCDQVDMVINEALNAEFSYTEISNAVHKSKNKKAVGIDFIPNELLKNTKVTEMLHAFFNACLKNRLILDTWRLMIINPIPKTTVASMDPLQYRGLLLQCCIYKILSVVINERVINHLEKYSLMLDTQNGFQKN